MAGFNPHGGKKGPKAPDFMQMLLNLGRGARAAVDPNFAENEYTRQWLEEGSQLRKPTPRPANPVPGSLGTYQQPGVGSFDRATGKFLGSGSTPIILGTRDGVTPDRTQSDLYRQYAPQPTFATNPLSQQYRAESEAGRKNMPEVVAGLTQGLEGEKAKAMQTWAQSNPMLAYREYNKRFPAGEPTIGPTPAALQADEALKGVSGFFPGAEPSGFAPGVANAVPAPWNTQGAMVDLNRGVQNIQPFQMAKTSGEAMPDFETTAAYSSDVSNRVSQFLKDKGAFNTFRG
jgi:hypothetical protein